MLSVKAKILKTNLSNGKTVRVSAANYNLIKFEYIILIIISIYFFIIYLVNYMTIFSLNPGFFLGGGGIMVYLLVKATIESLCLPNLM